MDAHLTEEEIGRFIENNRNEIDAERIYAHLHGCDRCFDDYQYTALLRGVWMTERENFLSSCDLMEAGMTILKREDGSSGGWKRFKIDMLRFRGFRMASVAAGVVALVAASSWISNETGRLPETVVRPIAAAATEASNRGMTVIPGTETYIDNDVTPYRSGYVAGNNLLSESLDYLVNKYAGKEIPRDASKWLITGFLVTGQSVTAGDYAREALVSYPGDIEITTLAALAAYRQNDLDESERLLRKVVDRDRKYAPGLFNLGVVLLAKRKYEKARYIFDELARLHPRSRLALKAATLISSRRNPPMID